MTSWNLFSLRCVLFCFFGGLGCLFPFLPLHMKEVGLTINEAHIVSIVAPLIAALGPLIVCPLADRIGGSGGRSMRMLLSVTVLLAALCYALLMCVPTVQRFEPRQPAVNFSCEPRGAAVLQERCMESGCYEWPEENIGPLMLSNCYYDCEMKPQQAALDNKMETTTEISIDQGIDDYDESGYGPLEVDIQKNYEDQNERRKYHSVSNVTPPHLCSMDETEQKICHVYTNSSISLTINASLLQASNMEAESEWCRYPLAGNFSCRIPLEELYSLGYSRCRVVCSVPDPYSSSNSVLAQSDCKRIIGDASLTFWIYLLVRSVGDIFSTTAVSLLDAAVVIATRETNLGGGDVGRELIWGSLGFAIFGPIVGGLSSYIDNIEFPDDPAYWIAFTGFLILMVLAALILLFSHSMPLNRPEWWTRHAKVIPLGGLKRHLSELIALSFVLILLGSLWSGIDSYLPWHIFDMKRSKLHLGLTLTYGALPAIPFLWNSEKVVHYCGHSNLLIIAFIFYIIRYTVLSFLEDVYWLLACEALEVFTLSLMWVTAILYMRQLVPRHLTVTGQGMAVLFHFCLGRCLGAVYVAIISAYTGTETEYLIHVYQVGAVISAIIATLYFIVYHCCLKPCCQRTVGGNPRNPEGVTQGPTTNGNYTPLRVYHNGSGQKGQVRY